MSSPNLVSAEEYRRRLQRHKERVRKQLNPASWFVRGLGRGLDAFDEAALSIPGLDRPGARKEGAFGIPRPSHLDMLALITKNPSLMAQSSRIAESPGAQTFLRKDPLAHEAFKDFARGGGDESIRQMASSMRDRSMGAQLTAAVMNPASYATVWKGFAPATRATIGAIRKTPETIRSIPATARSGIEAFEGFVRPPTKALDIVRPGTGAPVTPTIEEIAQQQGGIPFTRESPGFNVEEYRRSQYDWGDDPPLPIPLPSGPVAQAAVTPSLQTSYLRPGGGPGPYPRRTLPSPEGRGSKLGSYYPYTKEELATLPVEPGGRRTIPGKGKLGKYYPRIPELESAPNIQELRLREERLRDLDLPYSRELVGPKITEETLEAQRAINLDELYSETVPPISDRWLKTRYPKTLDRVNFRETPHGVSSSVAGEKSVPRYFYHTPPDLADESWAGKELTTLKSYRVLEPEAIPYDWAKDDTYIWMSSTDRRNAYIVDITKLDNSNMRFTGQFEGNLIHKGDIPKEAIVATPGQRERSMRQGMGLDPVPLRDPETIPTGGRTAGREVLPETEAAARRTELRTDIETQRLREEGIPVETYTGTRVPATGSRAVDNAINRMNVVDEAPIEEVPIGARRITTGPGVKTPTALTGDVVEEVPGFKPIRGDYEPVREQLRRSMGEGIEKLRGLPSSVRRAGMKVLGRDVPEVIPTGTDADLVGGWINKYGTPQEKGDAKILVGALRSAVIKGPKGEQEIIRTGERVQRTGGGIEAMERLRAQGFDPEDADQLSSMYAAFEAKQSGEFTSLSIDPEVFTKLLGEEGKQRLLVLVGNRSSKILNPDNPNAYQSIWDSKNSFRALQDLFEDGTIPIDYDLNLITDILGPGVGREIARRRPVGWMDKSGRITNEIINAPRSALASLDVSFLLRQAVFALPGESRKAFDAFKLAMRAYLPGGERAVAEMTQAMRTAERGRLWNLIVDEANIFISGGVRGGGANIPISAREEAFMGTWIGNVAPWIRGSERAHGAFLAKFRWDIAADYFSRMEKSLGRQLLNREDLTRLGYSSGDATRIIRQDRDLVKQLGLYINSLTGRGPMPLPQGIQSLANAFLFSPKLFTSRIAMPIQAGRPLVNLGISAATEGGKIPGFRNKEKFFKMALEGDGKALSVFKSFSRMLAQQYVSFVVTGLSLYYLAKLASPEVSKVKERVGRRIPTPDLPTIPGLRGAIPWIRTEGDPTSTDFGKIIFEGPGGQRVIDFFGGQTQLVRAGFQMIEGRRKGTSTQMTYPTDVWEVLQNLMISKFNPAIGVVKEYNLIPPITSGERWGKGTGFLGEDRDILEDIKKSPWKDMGPNEQSFWTRIGFALVFQDINSSIDQELNPVLPGSNRFNHHKDDPSLVAESPPISKTGAVARGAAWAPLPVLGVGFSAYTTKDDVAKALTLRDIGVSLPYLALPDFMRDHVNLLMATEEAKKGITREQQLYFKVQKIHNEEQDKYALIADRIRNYQESREAGQQRIKDVRDEARKARTALYNEAFGKEESERDKMLRMEGRGRAEILAEQVRDLADKEADRVRLAKGGLATGERSANIQAMLNGFQNSSDPVERAAYVRYMMDSYRTDMPPGPYDESGRDTGGHRKILLDLMHPSYRLEYNAARDYREKYRTGELRGLYPELYTDQ